MARVRPMGHCEECAPEESLKEIVSHGLCAKHNQQRLRAIWRRPEQSETQKQKLMEKLERDLIAIKNMCARWEREGFVAMKLITPETIQSFRTELEDYLDFRPTLKAAQPKTELEDALIGHRPPPPMSEDEDEETASKKATPDQYQYAPVVERPAAPTGAAAAAPEQVSETKKSSGKETPKTNVDDKKADELGKGNLDESIRHPPLSHKKQPQQAGTAEPNRRATKKGRS